MLTIVRGSVSPSAEDVFLTNGDSVQEFYDSYTAPTAVSFDLNDATSLWTGSAAQVDLSTEGTAAYDPLKVKYINYSLDYESGTLGTGWVMCYPIDTKMLYFQPLNQAVPNIIWARLVVNTNIVQVVGQAVSPNVEDYKIIEIRQAP